MLCKVDESYVNRQLNALMRSMDVSGWLVDTHGTVLAGSACKACIGALSPVACVRYPVQETLHQCGDGRRFVEIPLVDQEIQIAALILGPCAMTVDTESLAIVGRIMAEHWLMHGSVAASGHLFIRVAHYIDTHLTDNLSSQAMQTIFFVSANTLLKVVKAGSGMSVMRFIQERRLCHACNLLINTDKTVTQIAELSGVSDSNYFARIFKQRFDMSPRDYRGAYSRCKRSL